MRFLKYLVLAVAVTACSTLSAVAKWQPNHGGAQVAYYRSTPLPTIETSGTDTVTVYLNDQTGIWLNAEFVSAVRNGENYSGCARVAKKVQGALYVDSLVSPTKNFWGSKMHCGNHEVVWNTQRQGSVFSFCVPGKMYLKSATNVQLIVCNPDKILAYRAR